jgi:hypothetical protein
MFSVYNFAKEGSDKENLQVLEINLGSLKVKHADDFT